MHNGKIITQNCLSWQLDGSDAQILLKRYAGYNVYAAASMPVEEAAPEDVIVEDVSSEMDQALSVYLPFVGR